MVIATKDRTTIRELANRLAEIAALPEQARTVSLWKASNDLRPARPMVMIDQIPWHEMDVEGELALTTEDDFCRRLETSLRRKLYCWKHMRADMVVDAAIDIPKVIRGADFGMQRVEETASIDPRSNVVSHQYVDQLGTDEDVEKIRDPEIVLDADATSRAEEMAGELFEGILPVEMRGISPSFAAWDLITTWRGAAAVLWDLADKPQHMHHIIARLTDAQLSLLDQLESQGLLGCGQKTIHCTGAYTDELPAEIAGRAATASDLWTSGMAQIFSAVSPAMHDEFEIAYTVGWYSRFGLGYYGCCEPLHDKIDIIRKIPRVRKISMSPWVDVEVGAERIGGDFVFSRKPNPAFLAGDTWEPEVVENDLRETVEVCRKHGCPLELILKDISTVGYEPQRLWEWAQIAAQAVAA